MGRAVAICDAVLADLEENVTLPPHGTFLYCHPPTGFMTPERCPLLAVYVVDTSSQLIATEATYLDTVLIGAAWFEASASFAETASGTDSDLPRRVLDTIEAIGDRMKVYSVEIPGLAAGPPVLAAYGTLDRGTVEHNVSMVWRAEQQMPVSGTAPSV